MTPFQKRKLEEFRKSYDFSESKTLEYDNLVGIEDFLLKALQEQAEEIGSWIKGLDSLPWDEDVDEFLNTLK